MKKTPLLLLTVLALLIGLASPSRAASAGGAPVEIFPIEDVVPGLKGYGLTTFSGTEPERFEFEVLAKMDGWGPQSSVILIRTKHPVLEETGSVAGTSGSPLYIDGKLLGAIAYGFPYCKIPLAGVTPAAEMFNVAEIDKEAPAGEKEAAALKARLIGSEQG